MTQSSHAILVNAFRPAKEVDDPNLFAGRAPQLTQLTDSLHMIGTTPLIFGDRGLGKTSLAVQMGYVALGNTELLHSIGIQDRAFNDTDRYRVYLVTCTDSTRDFEGLVQLIINVVEEAEFTPTEESYSARHLTERTTSIKLSLKIIESGVKKKYEQAKARPSYQVLSLSEKLQQLIGIIGNSYGQPVLFIIDELDRLESTRRLASFIKATSGQFVKFMLVGIASNIGSLLVDHQSIERSLVCVEVPTMNDSELAQIIEKTEAYLSSEGIHVAFDRLAKRTIVDYASGFPWYVHVLGQGALLRAAGQYHTEVRYLDVLETANDISRNQFAQRYAKLYRDAVGLSPQREAVLRAFARSYKRDIPISEVYRVLKSSLGINNPSLYKRQLESFQYGHVIRTSHSGDRRRVCFTDEMFKVYIKLVPSIHDDIEDYVRRAFSP